MHRVAVLNTIIWDDFQFFVLYSFAVMRLGKKKEKDRDLEKEQYVEGVARLICSPKQSHPLRGILKDSRKHLQNSKTFSFHSLH